MNQTRKHKRKITQQILWSHNDQRSQWSQWPQQCPEAPGEKNVLSRGLNCPATSAEILAELIDRFFRAFY